jgi:phosphopantothenoylcysteine decarboxylase / phosphopantothenate---cysteine ligase
VQGARIFLGVSGSIAAYKAVQLARLLKQSGAQVQVGLSAGAQRFIQPLTFEAITAAPVLTSLWGSTQSQIEHVEQAHAVDLVLVAPATANLLARMAAGMADDIVAATCLSTTAAIVVAPAMETGMWNHPATQENLDRLRSRGVGVVDPESGELASGRSGLGRLAELETIVAAVRARLQPPDLAGRRIVITAGPTHERIDPVRILGNRSTGAMGIAFADMAAARGAHVDLVLGPTHLCPPPNVTSHRVESAQQMLQATDQLVDQADVFIAAAAVSDFRPEQSAKQKLKRNQAGAHSIALIENPDILATLAPRIKKGVVVGFAAETENLEENAKGKLVKKGCHMVVANHVGPGVGFGERQTEIVLVTKDEDSESFGPASKSEVACFVLDRIAGKLNEYGES